MEVEITDDVGRFAETYSSFNKIINKLQRQYISLKETHEKQSEDLGRVNESLQSAISENRAVTEFLNSILFSLGSGVIAVDTSGYVSHINPSARSLLGLDEKAVKGDRLKYADAINAVENEECSALKAIELATGLPSGEKKIVNAYGRTLTLSVSISLLLNRGGEAIGAVEMFQDITKLRAIEEQLAQMKVLASMGEMSAAIAHEIRNPLLSVSGFASILARDLKDDPEKKDMAQKIMAGVKSINSIIQTLLDFARKEQLNKAKVDLNSYLKLIIDDFMKESGYSDYDDRLILDLPTSATIPVDLDRQLFKRVIGNLIKNGFELINESEPVTVTIATRLLRPEEAHREYGGRIELSGDETAAEITVTDNGPGMENEAADNLFSPFYTTKEDGIGLGLSIAWKIIKAHNGDIKAESKLESGTRFSILLPVCKK